MENSERKNRKDPRGRILCVTSNFPRWSGDSTTPFVLNLAEDLQAQGWQVDVLAPHAPGAAKKETINGIQVERFSYSWPASTQTVCYQGGALINLRKRPAEKLKLPMLVAAELLAVAWRLMTRKYDVVHSHWVLPQGFTGMLATKVLRVPHVITVHGSDIFSLRGKWLTKLKRLSLHSASAVTVNSSFTQAGTEQVAPNIGTLHRIPMGVDARPLSDAELAEAAEIRARYHSGEGPLLIFVGRLVEEKGGQDAIAAVKLLHQEMPGLRLLIVGEGQDRQDLEQLVERENLQQHVQFLGWVDPSQVRTHLAAADIFVGPSRTSREGGIEAQGLTFVEAMTVGTPVIASRLGGIVDAVQHEKTGLLVEEKSPEQLAEAIQTLVNTPSLTLRLRDSARNLVTAEFSRNQTALEFSTIFGRLASPNPKRPN